MLAGPCHGAALGGGGRRSTGRLGFGLLAIDDLLDAVELVDELDREWELVSEFSEGVGLSSAFKASSASSPCL